MATFNVTVSGNSAPSTQLRWSDTNTLEPRSGSYNSVNFTRTPIYDVDGDNILSIIWQINTGTGWVDHITTELVSVSLPTVNNLNQYRIKVEDIYNNIGYSNIIEYTKQVVVAPTYQNSYYQSCSDYDIPGISYPVSFNQIVSGFIIGKDYSGSTPSTVSILGYTSSILGFRKNEPPAILGIGETDYLKDSNNNIISAFPHNISLTGNSMPNLGITNTIPSIELPSNFDTTFYNNGISRIRTIQYKVIDSNGTEGEIRTATVEIFRICP